MADEEGFHSSNESQNGTAYQGFQTYSPIVDGDRVSTKGKKIDVKNISECLHVVEIILVLGYYGGLYVW